MQQKKRGYDSKKLGQYDVLFSDRSLKPVLRTFNGTPGYQIFCLRLNRKATHILTALTDGTVRIYNLAKIGQVSYYSSSNKSKMPAVSARWLPTSDNQFLVCNAEGIVLVGNNRTQKYDRIKVDQNLFAMDVDVEGNSFIVSTQKLNLLKYDLTTFKLAYNFEPGTVNNNYDGHTNRVFSIKFIDKNTFITGGWDSSIRLWDIRTPTKSLKKLTGPNISGDGIDVYKNKILTCSYRNENQVQQWDLGTGKLIKSYVWDPNQPTKGAYCYTGRLGTQNWENLIFAGSTTKNQLNIFRQDKGERGLSLGFNGGIYSMDICKELICIGGSEGIVYAFGLEFAK